LRVRDFGVMQCERTRDCSVGTATDRYAGKDAGPAGLHATLTRPWRSCPRCACRPRRRWPSRCGRCPPG
jgi:hypothetical protein